MSLPQSLFIGSILSTNNACDADGDKAAGRKTLAIVIGRQMAPWLVYLQTVTGSTVLVLLGVSGRLPLAIVPSTFAAAIVVLLLLRRMHKRGYSHETKRLSMLGISKVFLVLSFAQLAGLATGLFTIS